MNRFSLEAKVGLFFIAFIAIFAFVWFKVLDFSLKEGFVLKARFRSVEGLAKGAQVQIAGIRIGVVKDVTYDSETGKAAVAMEINDAYRNSIPEGSRITLKTKGLLGDKLVVIEPGKPNARKLKPGEEITTVYEPPETEKILDGLGVITQDVQALASQARKQVIDDKGAEKIDSIINNTGVISHDLREILSRNKDKINRTVDNSENATKDLSELTARNKDKLNRSVDEMEKFSKSMDKTSEKFGRVATDLEGLTKDVRQGRGTIGKLASDDTLYREAQALVKDFRNISATIQSGRGTVGRLVNDPELYFEARRAIRNLNKTAEDVSEATPISTLANILGAVAK